MKPSEALIRSAATLARTAPRDWQLFVQAFEDHMIQRRDELVASPLDTLQVAQGRAQEARDVLKVLKDCLKGVDKLEERRK